MLEIADQEDLVIAPMPLNGQKDNGYHLCVTMVIATPFKPTIGVKENQMAILSVMGRGAGIKEEVPSVLRFLRTMVSFGIMIRSKES